MAEGRAEIDAAITAYLERLAAAIEADAKAACPVKTGHLSQSIGHEVQGQVARIGTNVDYALAVEFGSRPHVIRGNPYLAFHWDKIGQDVVLRSVNHPGTPEQPFLRSALYRVRGEA